MPAVSGSSPGCQGVPVPGRPDRLAPPDLLQDRPDDAADSVRNMSVASLRSMSRAYGGLPG